MNLGWKLAAAVNGWAPAELLHRGRPVLLDLSDGRVDDAARGWADRVDIAGGQTGDVQTCAVLIRPDGYIAWAADTFDSADEDRLHTALRRWFGVSGAARGALRRDGAQSWAPGAERTA